MSTSTNPPPPVGGGNGKYIAVAVVLVLGMGGLIAWRVLSSPPPPPVVTLPTVTTSAPAPPPPKFDDIPPPPPVEDAGPDTGTRPTGPAIRPCEVTSCNGRKTEDMEAGLGMLARQTRKKCYEPALGQDPSLTGHVSIKLKIAGDGEICSSNVGTADPGLQSVGECTSRLIQAAGRVAAPQGGCVLVDFPITYKPMGK